MSTMVRTEVHQRESVAPGTAGGAARARHAWLDVARGSVVLAVVLMHVGLYHYLPLIRDGHRDAFDFWTALSAGLDVVRMPTLLVISGWLASTQIKRGLRDPKTRKRVVTNAWLYMLWLTLYAVLAVVLDAGSMAQAVTPDQVVPQLLVPYSTLWFLAALVWYVVVLALVRRVPAPLVVGASLAVSAVSWTLLPVELGLWVRIPHYLVFFALGVHGKDAVAAWAARPVAAITGGAIAVALGSWFAEGLVVLEWPTYPATFVMSLGALGIVLGGATVLAHRSNPLERLLAWVGRRTASVYVLHYPLLMVLTVAAAGPLYDWPRAWLADPVGVWLYPVVATGAFAGFALAVHAVADRIGLGWLFRLPTINRTPRPSVAGRVQEVGAGWETTTGPYATRAQLGGR